MAPDYSVATPGGVCQCKIEYHIVRQGGREVFVLDEPMPRLGDVCEKCGLPHLVDLEDDRC